MNKRRINSLVAGIASAVLLSACATNAPQPHTSLPNPNSIVTINLDMDSFNLSSLKQMPTPETLKFTLDLESKASLAERTKDDLVALWPARDVTSSAPKTAPSIYGLCLDH